MTATPPVASATVLAERHDGVLVLTLNRPDRLNAWNDELEAAYFAHLDEADDDPDVRVVVVTGAGRGFCAGADLDDLRSEQARRSALDRARPRSRPMELRKPLIAAITGAAAGIGLVEALYADLRFCAPKAKLTTAFARRGLIAEYGMSWLLARLVGPGRALDLLLSGRVVLGEEAGEMGLVDIVDDEPLAAALRYAGDLSRLSSPASMAVIKRQVWGDLGRDFAAAFTVAERELAASFERTDVLEGVRSYLESRPPEFPPLDPAPRG
jgi:enoyl-CoA hydratase/carnithine racemase